MRLRSLTSAVMLALFLSWQSCAIANSDTFDSLVTTGANAYSSGDYNAALNAFQKALTLAEATGDVKKCPPLLGALSYVYARLFDYKDAVDDDLKALAEARQVGDKSTEEKVLTFLGSLYYNQANYGKSLVYAQQGLAAATALDDRRQMGLNLAQMGMVYLSLGQKDKALDYAKRAMTIASQMPKNTLPIPQSSAIIQQLAAIVQAFKTVPDASDVRDNQALRNQLLDLATQGLNLATQLKDDSISEMMLQYTGEVYLEAGEYSNAVEFEQQAIPLANQLGDREAQGDDLIHLGMAYFGLGQNTNALNSQAKALDIMRRIGDRSSEAWALGDMMLVYQSIKEPALAVFYGKQAVDVYQSIRADEQDLDPDARKSYLQRVSGSYRTLADILVSQGRIPEAEQVLSLLKDQEDALYLHRGDTSGSVSMTNVEADWQAKYDAIGQSEEQIGEQLEAVSRQLQALGAPSGLSPDDLKTYQSLSVQQANLQKQSDAADAAWDEYISDLAKSFSNPAAAQDRISDFTDDDTFSDLVAGYAKEGTKVAIIRVMITDSGCTMILFTPNGRQPGYFAVPSSDLYTQIEAFRASSSNPAADPRPAGETLYKELIGPIEKPLDDYDPQVVLWWMDGRLNDVPMPAIWDGREYLVQRWQNVVINKQSIPHLAGVNDTNSHSALGFGDSVGAPPDFPALPNVTQELYDVVADPKAPLSHGVLAGEIFLNGDFTAEAFKTDVGAHDADVVHVATHFALDPADGSLSYLLAGDGKIGLPDLDKDRLFKGVRLLTLSACETGESAAGSAGDGEGFDSLAAVAQRQGAMSVVASLWDVQDNSTSLLMQKFYSLYQQGLPVSAALQQAQLSLLGQPISSGPPSEGDGQPVRGAVRTDDADTSSAPPFTPDPAHPYAHPYYWAPFILIGNWK